MEEKVFSVVEFNKIVKRIFEAEEMLFGILVTGEVTNFKVSGAHAYFNLKDNEAQIFCTFFNITRSSNSVIPKNGDKVVVRCSPDFYVKGGSLSLKVTKITPAGLGALYLKFLELKEKLEKEGLFDEKHKKAIPAHPNRIGVVTSPTGAVIRDIINVTRRRNPFCDIVLFPVKVQGEGAEIDVAKGVFALDNSKLVDVIIVGRGGGSMEDLQPFNTEIVARAVYNCRTPIISAVGHETDFSLCDFASDLRAPTPSAAAELANPDVISSARTFLIRAKEMQRKSVSVFETKSKELSHDLDTLRFLGERSVTKGENEVKSKAKDMLNLLRAIFVEKRNGLKTQIATMDSMNPLRLLDKGYAKVLKSGKNLSSVQEIAVGEEITTYLVDGQMTSRVEKIVEKKV